MSKVLLIEPEMKTQKLYETAIEFQGITVLTAKTMEEALDKIDETLSLVILDTSTPDLYQINVIKEVKERAKKQIPVIIIADLKERNVIFQKSVNGAFEYLSRSQVTIGDIIKKVRNVTDQGSSK